MSLYGALNICEEILTSKKYATLYRPLVLRVCEAEYKKYSNDKDRIKGARNALHAMYGAYLSADIYKKAGKLLDILITSEQAGVKSNTLEQILRLHSSTKERLRTLSDFYQFIFDNIGKADTVLDIGCGFNPFTLPFFPEGKPAKFYAMDIDERIADLNNRYLSALGMPALAGCRDIAVDTPSVTADVAFLFKILPLIERQAKGRSAKLLSEIKAQYLVVSYPTKSLSGKEKGMQAFYAAAFEEVIGGNLFISAKKEIGTELVYVLTKGKP